MKNSKIYALAAVFLFIAIIAASAYYFANDDSSVTGNVISLKSIFRKQIASSARESPVRIPPERPISSFSREGVFASKSVEGGLLAFRDLSLEIFQKPNMDYRAVVKWKINAPSSTTIAFSDITFYTNKTKRISGETFLMHFGINQSFEPISNVELSYEPIEEGEDYLIVVDSFLNDGRGELTYNFSFKTPAVAPARVHCNKIVDNGLASDRFNIFFVPVGYTNEEISSGTYDSDVRMLCRINKKSF